MSLVTYAHDFFSVRTAYVEYLVVVVVVVGFFASLEIASFVFAGSPRARAAVVLL